MLKLLSKNTAIVAFMVSLLVNLILFFVGNHYRGEINLLSSEKTNIEQRLAQCQTDNDTWKNSYDNLLNSCKVQSDVIISLATDLRNERENSEDVVRDILLLSSDENSEVVEQQATGGLNETHAPHTVGLDDALPDSLIRMLERSYDANNTGSRTITLDP